MTAPRRNLLPVLTSAALLLATAGAARAATVTYDPVADSLVYQAAPGEGNDLVVSDAAGRLRFAEQGGVPMAEAAAGVQYCIQVTPSELDCARATQDTEATVRLADGDDRATAATAAGAVSLLGGDGADTLTGGAGADLLDGEGGSDALAGGPGDDTAVMGASRAADGDRDLVDGGPGNDSVAFDGRTQPVRVDLAAGVAGEPGEDDAVTGVEIVLGGAAGDVIAGDAGPTTVFGGGGDDRIDGRGGGDDLRGGEGDDTFTMGVSRAGDGDGDVVVGGNGVDTVQYPRALAVAVSVGGGADGEPGEGDQVSDDTENVEGGAGPDTLVGSDDANRLVGGPGRDVLRGLDGNDVLDTRDGDPGDTADCGDGPGDLLLADLAGDPADGCETVNRASAAPPPPPPPPGGQPPAREAARDRIGTPRFSAAGVLRLPVTCPAAARPPCMLRVTVVPSPAGKAAAGRRLLDRSVRLGPGAKRLEFRMSTANLRRAASAGRVQVRVSLVVAYPPEADTAAPRFTLPLPSVLIRRYAGPGRDAHGERAPAPATP